MDYSSDFRVGAVVGQSISIFLANAVPFTTLCLFVSTITVVHWLAEGRIPPLSPDYSIYSRDGLIDVAIDILFGQLAVAALTYGTVEGLRGRRVPIVVCLGRGVSLMASVLAVTVVYWIATYVGLLALVVPGIVIATVLWVVVPVAVIERLGVIASLRRSAQLTKGYRWQVFGILLTSAVVTVCPGFIAGIVAGFAAGGAGMSNAVFSFAFVYWLLAGVTIAFTAVLVAVSYYRLRVAKEGVDIEDIARVFD